MRLRREAEAAKAREEEEAKEKAEAAAKEAQNLEKWKRWRMQILPAEPGADVKEATRISIRLPSGERVVRKFAPQSDIEDIYAFVECYDLMQSETSTSSESSPPAGYEHKYKFNLVSPMPRVVYDLETGGEISKRIGRSGNLIVESIVDDDEEDE